MRRRDSFHGNKARCPVPNYQLELSKDGDGALTHLPREIMFLP